MSALNSANRVRLVRASFLRGLRNSTREDGLLHLADVIEELGVDALPSPLDGLIVEKAILAVHRIGQRGLRRITLRSGWSRVHTATLANLTPRERIALAMSLRFEATKQFK